MHLYCQLILCPAHIVFGLVTGLVNPYALTRHLCSVLGMSVLAMSVDLITLYLAFETVSIPSYVLVGMRRADRLANEATLRLDDVKNYFPFGQCRPHPLLLPHKEIRHF